MNRWKPQKTPLRASAKRHKPGTTPSAPPAVTATEARARQKKLDQLQANALQACRDQWAYCHDNPYDTAASVAYEKMVAVYLNAFRAADPERYDREQTRRREIEAAYPPGFHQAVNYCPVNEAACPSLEGGDDTLIGGARSTRSRRALPRLRVQIKR